MEAMRILQPRRLLRRSLAGGRAGAVLVTVVTLGGLLLAACGSASSASTTTTTGKGATGTASITAYFTCLKQHGVNIKIPSFGSGTGGSLPAGAGSIPTGSGPPSGFPGAGGQFNSPKFKKAAAACASLRPTGGSGGGVSGTAFAAYRNCLKIHGVTLAGGAGSSPTGTTLNTSDPKVKVALAACASLRPKPTAPSGSSAG
jgi:hypothetical protein